MYIFNGTDWQNLFDNQRILELMITSLILVNFVFDSAMILSGQIRCSSVSEAERLMVMVCKFIPKRRLIQREFQEIVQIRAVKIVKI